MKSPASYAFAAIAIALATACAGDNSPTSVADTSSPVAAAPAPATPVVRQLPITDASFGCIRDLEAVRGFYVGNLLGDMDATLAAANSANGAVYPPGSVVQLVPGEAMVKHGKGFNPATNDWEFFELDIQPTATKIKVRGFSEAVNQFGGNCLACHVKAEAKWDMICEQGHGCDPIPVTPVMAKAIQNTDPRCPQIELPADQQAALQQLAAFRAAATRAASPAAPAAQAQ